MAGGCFLFCFFAGKREINQKNAAEGFHPTQQKLSELFKPVVANPGAVDWYQLRASFGT